MTAFHAAILCWTTVKRGSLQNSNSMFNTGALATEFIKNTFKVHLFVLDLSNYRSLPSGYTTRICPFFFLGNNWTDPLK